MVNNISAENKTSYSLDSNFHYFPNNTLDFKRFTYNLTNSNEGSIKSEGLLLLTIYEGYKCIYDEKNFNSSNEILICNECKESYHKIYNMTACLNEKTKRNYFFNGTNYYPCAEKCETCENDENNCLQCVEKANCCLDFFYIDENGIYNCVKKCSGIYPLQINKTKECVSSCPEQFPFKYLNECVENCTSPYSLLVKEINQCFINCPDDYELLIKNENECVNNCNTQYPRRVKKINQCVKDCPDEYPLFTKPLNLCDDMCNHHYPYLMNQTKQCVNNCPDPLKPNQLYICSFIVENISEPIINDNTVQYSTTQDLDTFKQSINENVEALIKGNQLSNETTPSKIEINSDSFTFYLYPNNDNSTDISKKEKINLGECEEILRKSYDIPKEEEILIGQIEYSTNSLINSQYSVYDKYGNELDLMLCKESPITVSVPINIDEDIDIQTIKSLQENDGINVFNASENIFIDKCTPYSFNGKDMTVSDRREKLMKNITLCRDGCNLINVNFDLNIIECECLPSSIKVDQKTDNKQNTIEQINYKNEYNFYLFLCYQLAIRLDLIITNYGNWIILSCIIIMSIFTLIFKIVHLKSVYIFVFKYTSNPPIINSFLKKNKHLSSHYQSPTSVSSMNNNENEAIQKTKEGNIDNNKLKRNVIDPYVLEQLYELSYEQAMIIHDKISFCKFFLNSLIEKEIILSTIFNQSIFYPFSLRLIYLIFEFEAFFFFNGLFFTDNYISKRFNSKTELNFTYILKNELIKSFYACILGMLVGKILIFITSIRTNFCKLLTYKYSPDYQLHVSKFILSIKKRLIILLIIIFLFSLVFWYFIIIFCNMYSFNQISLLEATLISIVINCILFFILCFISGLIRYVGLKCKSSLCFGISQFCFSLF